MAADKLTGELHAMQDWYRECVWHPANFASWRRTTLEPAWRHDALEQYDGWSDDLPELELVRILVQLRRMCAPR